MPNGAAVPLASGEVCPPPNVDMLRVVRPLEALTGETLVWLGEVQFLPPLGMGALFLWGFTFGIGEETGWRGYALPRLQNGRNALLATFILWVFWALWHLPAFFYLYDPAILIGWLIGQFAGAILFTRLFNSSGGKYPHRGHLAWMFQFHRLIGCRKWTACRRCQHPMGDLIVAKKPSG